QCWNTPPAAQAPLWKRGIDSPSEGYFSRGVVGNEIPLETLKGKEVSFILVTGYSLSPEAFFSMITLEEEGEKDKVEKLEIF
ncbi:MAG: hypothetical protein Q4E67_02630, partial [Planctomycetia bacterium]|nr:hypothetical protein [Planctomycetia bacterium]